MEGLTIPGVSDVHDNFDLRVFFADHDCVSMSTNCVTRNATFTAVNPGFWSLPLTVSETRSLNISVHDNLTMEACDWIKFICVQLLAGNKSTFIEKEPRNNLHCNAIIPLCNPGRHSLKLRCIIFLLMLLDFICAKCWWKIL